MFRSKITAALGATCFVLTLAIPAAASAQTCCPPWSKATLTDRISYQSAGGIGGQYRLIYTPSPTVDSQMGAYVIYLNHLSPYVSALSVVLTLYDGGSGNNPVQGAPIGGPMTIGWNTVNSSSVSGGPFPLLQPNHWYILSETATLGVGAPPLLNPTCINDSVKVRFQVL